MVQLKDVIHYYLGQKFLFDNHEWRIYRIDKQVTGKRYSANGGWRYVTCNINEIKLILRSLECLTDEEIKELIGWDNLNQKYLDVSFEKCVNGIIVYYTIDASDDCGTTFPMNHKITFHTFFPKEWQYLLSKGFDLFQLINNKLAIDLKTLTTCPKP